MLYMLQNNGADQLCGYCAADLRLFFTSAKIRFSHDTANFIFFFTTVCFRSMAQQLECH